MWLRSAKSPRAPQVHNQKEKKNSKSRTYLKISKIQESAGKVFRGIWWPQRLWLKIYLPNFFFFQSFEFFASISVCFIVVPARKQRRINADITSWCHLDQYDIFMDALCPRGNCCISFQKIKILATHTDLSHFHYCLRVSYSCRALPDDLNAFSFNTNLVLRFLLLDTPIRNSRYYVEGRQLR